MHLKAPPPLQARKAVEFDNSPHLQRRYYIYICLFIQLDGLMQERRNSIANAPKLRLSCTILSLTRRYSLWPCEIP